MDKTKCTVCGLCVKVCTGAPLFIENNTVKVDHRGSLAATWYSKSIPLIKPLYWLKRKVF
ncbi:hypothetical protein [Clostridium felsineum]|uniref:hypothetical protein n=1 Tax=Clostridium felsineum TaxID=36839 RepID=UPI00396A0B26